MMRRAWIIAVCAAAFATIGRGCSAPERGRTINHEADAPAAAADLVVMTFNVNFALADHEDNLAAIDDADADIVLLQETTEDGERAARARLSERYPYMQFRACCRAGGLGILSKYPITKTTWIDSPIDWFPAGRFVVDAPGGPVQLLDVHLRPPVSDTGSWTVGFFTTSPVRRKEIEVFRAALDAKLPTIIAGDFNENERGDALGWLETRGYTSVLRRFDPHATTWSWALPLTSLRARLDHIVVGGAWQAIEARVIDAGVSDHKPVVAVLRRR